MSSFVILPIIIIICMLYVFPESTANPLTRAKAVNMKDTVLFPHRFNCFIRFDRGTCSSPTSPKGRRFSVCGGVNVFVGTIITWRIKYDYNVAWESDLSFVGNKKKKCHDGNIIIISFRHIIANILPHLFELLF